MSWLFLGTPRRGRASCRRKVTPHAGPGDNLAWVSGGVRGPLGRSGHRASRFARICCELCLRSSHAGGRRSAWWGDSHYPATTLLRGLNWELWRTKTGWVIYLAPFAGRATLQLLRRALLGPTPRPLKPRCRGISGLGQLSGKSSARGSAPTGFLRRHRRGRGVGVALGTPTHTFDLHIAS